ncbi:DUF6923 family protein [Nocardioides sp. NPDC101246]|uniref:Vgb family protein n=1 Tax=Nocardioides sp. NPDC101246 TaxID=3364336 RepID=UPI003819207D
MSTTQNRRARRMWLAVTVASVLALSLAPSGPAHAEDGDGYHFDEIKVSDTTDLICNQKGGPDGDMWFVEEGATRIGHLDLETGDVKKFPLPPMVTVPFLGDIAFPSTLAVGPCDLAFDEDDKLWFNFQQKNVVGYLETSPPYEIKTFPLPPASVPMSIAEGADGYMYSTLLGQNKIAKINPTTGHIDYISVPTPASGIIGGTAGKDGYHYFVEWFGNKVLRLDYETGEMREYPIPSPASLPIVIRWIDGALWFTEMTSGKIARFDPTTGEIEEIPVPNRLGVPISLTEGKDGDIYFDNSVGDTIGRLDPQTRTIVADYPIPRKITFPEEITTGPDGALWFPQTLSGHLGRLWVDSFGTDPGAPPSN